MMQQILAIVSSLCFVVPACDKVAIVYSSLSIGRQLIEQLRNTL